jgi:hypothetical protein
MSNGDGEGVDSLSGVAKVLTGGLTAAIGLAAAIGASTGELARLFRNHPAGIVTAMILAIVAVACSLFASVLGKTITRKDFWRVGLLVIGVVAFSSSLLAIVLTQAAAVQQQVDRPIITATWKKLDGLFVLEVTTKASGVKAGQQMKTEVYGSFANPVTQESSQFSRYYGSTGPDPEGRAEQNVQVVLPKDISGITVVSVVGGKLEGCPRSDSPTGENAKVACVHLSAPDQGP